MPFTSRLSTLIVLVLTLILRLGAQNREGLMGDLIRDVTEVQTKIVGLAKAMPAAAFDWRPAKGVRSSGEVFMHVAADNYFMPAAMGMSAPAETEIDGKEYKTAAAFEKRTMTRDQIIAELEKSFGFLKASMTAVPDAKLDAPLDVFGQKTTSRGLWISATTHLHEHLGQLIAYARSNNVTPPWTK
jgi:DinB superfamily